MLVGYFKLLARHRYNAKTEGVNLQVYECQYLNGYSPSTLILKIAASNTRARPIVVCFIRGTFVERPWCKCCTVDNSHCYASQEARIDKKYIEEAASALFASPFQRMWP